MKLFERVVVKQELSSVLKSAISPDQIAYKEGWLKLLGVIFQENPSDWDFHVDNLLRKASSRLYILGVCKYFRHPKEQLTK